jgi:hypothetical protein
VNRDFTCLQATYLGDINIQTDNKIADIGQTGTGYKSDIPGPNNGNLHFTTESRYS